MLHSFKIIVTHWYIGQNWKKEKEKKRRWLHLTKVIYAPIVGLITLQWYGPIIDYSPTHSKLSKPIQFIDKTESCSAFSCHIQFFSLHINEFDYPTDSDWLWILVFKQERWQYLLRMLDWGGTHSMWVCDTHATWTLTLDTNSNF